MHRLVPRLRRAPGWLVVGLRHASSAYPSGIKRNTAEWRRKVMPSLSSTPLAKAAQQFQKLITPEVFNQRMQLVFLQSHGQTRTVSVVAVRSLLDDLFSPWLNAPDEFRSERAREILVEAPKYLKPPTDSSVGVSALIPQLYIRVLDGLHEYGRYDDASWIAREMPTVDTQLPLLRRVMRALFFRAEPPRRIQAVLHRAAGLKNYSEGPFEPKTIADVTSVALSVLSHVLVTSNDKACLTPEYVKSVVEATEIAPSIQSRNTVFLAYLHAPLPRDASGVELAKARRHRIKEATNYLNELQETFGFKVDDMMMSSLMDSYLALNDKKSALVMYDALSPEYKARPKVALKFVKAALLPSPPRFSRILDAVNFYERHHGYTFPADALKRVVWPFACSQNILGAGSVALLAVARGTDITDNRIAKSFQQAITGSNAFHDRNTESDMDDHGSINDTAASTSTSTNINTNTDSRTKSSRNSRSSDMSFESTLDSALDKDFQTDLQTDIHGIPLATVDWATIIDSFRKPFAYRFCAPAICLLAANLDSMRAISARARADGIAPIHDALSTVKFRNDLFPASSIVPNPLTVGEMPHKRRRPIAEEEVVNEMPTKTMFQKMAKIEGAARLGLLQSCARAGNGAMAAVLLEEILRDRRFKRLTGRATELAMAAQFSTVSSTHSSSNRRIASKVNMLMMKGKTDARLATALYASALVAQNSTEATTHLAFVLDSQLLNRPERMPAPIDLRQDYILACRRMQRDIAPHVMVRTPGSHEDARHIYHPVSHDVVAETVSRFLMQSNTRTFLRIHALWAEQVLTAPNQSWDNIVRTLGFFHRGSGAVARRLLASALNICLCVDPLGPSFPPTAKIHLTNAREMCFRTVQMDMQSTDCCRNKSNPMMANPPTVDQVQQATAKCILAHRENLAVGLLTNSYHALTVLRIVSRSVISADRATSFALLKVYLTAPPFQFDEHFIHFLEHSEVPLPLYSPILVGRLMSLVQEAQSSKMLHGLEVLLQLHVHLLPENGTLDLRMNPLFSMLLANYKEEMREKASKWTDEEEMELGRRFGQQITRVDTAAPLFSELFTSSRPAFVIGVLSLFSREGLAFPSDVLESTLMCALDGQATTDHILSMVNIFPSSMILTHTTVERLCNVLSIEMPSRDDYKIAMSAIHLALGTRYTGTGLLRLRRIEIHRKYRAESQPLFQRRTREYMPKHGLTPFDAEKKSDLTAPDADKKSDLSF